MREIRRDWVAAEASRKGGNGVEVSSDQTDDLYLVHRVLADFPQAYAALREAYRVRDAAAGPVALCSQCRCVLDEGGG